MFAKNQSSKDWKLSYWDLKELFIFCQKLAVEKKLCFELSKIPVYYCTMFEQTNSDNQVKILVSGHYVPPPHAGVYLPGAMSERVNKDETQKQPYLYYVGKLSHLLFPSISKHKMSGLGLLTFNWSLLWMH